MRSGFVTGVVLALAFVISGCGGDDAPSTAGTPTPSPSAAPSSTPTPGPKVDCGKVFDRADAEALAGQKLAAGVNQPLQSLTACQWSAAETGAYVQVLSVPASQWAQIVPDAISTVLADPELEFPGRDKLVEARDRIVGGQGLDDAAACGVFSTLASSLSAQPAGTIRFVTYQPTEEAPQAVNGQACIKGHYYSVQYFALTFKKSPAVQRRIERALDRAIAKVG